MSTNRQRREVYVQSVRLPISYDALLATPAPLRGPAAPAVRSLHEPPAISVALFDDDADTVEMLVQSLRYAGLRAYGRARAVHRVDLIRFVRFVNASVVLYDVTPPYRASLDRFRRVRAAAFPAIPVILTTTHAQRLRLFLREGEVDGVFLKPCDLSRLADAVRTAAAGR